VADQVDSGLSIEQFDTLSIVSLKVSRNAIDAARDKYQLAKPSQIAGSDPRSLWLGPDRWLLTSDTLPPAAMIDSCSMALDGILHHAVDYSSGLTLMRIVGPDARQLLETGTGTDLRPASFPVNSCCRTRFAQIAAVIVAAAPDSYDVYVDRSYGAYLAKCLAESSSIYSSYRHNAAV